MSSGIVRVRVAAVLRFFLRLRHRSGDVTVPVDDAATFGHIVESLGIPRTEIGDLCTGNRSVPLSARPQDGDVVDVLPVQRPQPMIAPRFVLDVHLGTLARRLRLLGIDAAYRNDATDDELVVQAAAEQRILLTQDRGLLRRRALVAGAYVLGSRPDEQLADVLDRFDPQTAPWSRCPACNGDLRPVPKPAIQQLLMPGTRRSYTEFAQCQACGRPYWRGAHASRLEAIVAVADDRPSVSGGIRPLDR